MKRITNLRAVAGALTIAGVFAFSGQVTADTVTANLGLVNQKSGTIRTNLGDGRAGLLRSPTQGGTFAGDLAPFGTGAFLAFCLQPGETLNNNVEYTVEALNDAPVTSPGSTMGLAAQDALEILLGNVFPVFSATQTVQNVTVGGMSQKQQFMAVQLAIWEVANERTQTITNYSVASGSGSFFADSGYNPKVVSQANAWLDLLDTSAWRANELDNLVALVHPTYQDFVAQVVPIPAAAWLFGSALVGTVVLGRRKQRQKKLSI